jgi:hypothetical protein
VTKTAAICAGALALAAHVATACTSGPQAPLWDYSIPAGPGDASASTEVSVDLYLDSTASMEGFAVASGAGLPPFVSAVEGALGQGWTRSAIRYLRFGTRVAEWPRDRFVRGMVTSGFYHEHGVSETTNIDRLIAAADASHLSVVVTDMFQADADVNAVVAALKNGFIANGVPVALLPVPSAFSGVVFDARVPAFRYASRISDPASRRPFYLLMFGPDQQIQRLVALLASRGLADPAQLLLVTRRLVERQTVSWPETPRLTNVIHTMSRSPRPFEFTLDLRDDRPAVFDLTADIQLQPGVPAVDVSHLQAVVTRRRVPKSGPAGPEEPAADLMLAAPLQLDGSGVRVPLRLQFAERSGSVAYRVDIVTPSVGAFTIPAWVDDWSSDDPRPGHEPNKTLNLRPFVEGLLQAWQSTSQLSVLRFFLRIRKP